MLAEQEKMDKLRKVMDGLNNRKQKLKPGDDMPAVFIAGERPDLLNPGVISSDNLALNTILHGGLRRGTLTEFVGNPGVGKTHLAFDCVAPIQRAGGTVVYCLSEAGFPEDAARIHNVDLDRLFVIEGFYSAEECLNTLKDMLIDENQVRRNLIDLVIIDSISAMRPKGEVDKALEDGFESNTIGMHARLWSKAFPIILPCIHNTAVVLVNQYRTNAGGYGAPRIKTGGNAAGYYPHVSLSVATSRDDLIYEGTGKNRRVTGHTVRLMVEKTKGGMGGRMYEEAAYDVYYQVGTDNNLPLFHAALATGLVAEPSQSYFVYNLPKALLSPVGLWKDDGKAEGPVKIHGQDKAVDVIRNCESIREILTSILRDGEDVEEALAEAA